MSEIPKTPEVPEEKSLECPVCGCRHSYAIETRKFSHRGVFITIRIRRCRHCSYQYRSKESRIPDDSVSLPQRKSKKIEEPEKPLPPQPDEDPKPDIDEDEIRDQTEQSEREGPVPYIVEPEPEPEVFPKRKYRGKKFRFNETAKAKAEAEAEAAKDTDTDESADQFPPEKYEEPSKPKIPFKPPKSNTIFPDP